jgi:hypothetical protein
MNMHEIRLKILTGIHLHRNLMIAIISYMLIAMVLIYLHALKTTKAAQSGWKSNQIASESMNVDINAMRTWHLFGLSDSGELHKLSDSNIELIGIIYQGKSSRAIMLINASERTFSNGEKIDSNYTIQEIEPSRIVIATKDGVEEIAMFESIKDSNQAQSATNKTNNTQQVLQPQLQMEQPQVEQQPPVDDNPLLQTFKNNIMQHENQRHYGR